MPSEEFRDSVVEIVQQHSSDLSAADLRELSDDLQQLADQWEQAEEVLG